ncbi:MAG: LysR family transcriptional regulator [Zoogloea sp.]|uniref:LysR family transcriptional regulator n=1 Tax=Zoogloea sp. TaxID=49181 RepID=UPI003F2B0CB1
MNYDLIDLKLFAAIAEERNLSRGAARVHLAPSSASHRLARLESNLQAALFERHARGLQLTRAGEALLGHTRRIFANLEQMHADISPFARGLWAQVSLYGNTNAINCFLPEDLGGFLVAHPQVRVTMKEMTSPEICRSVIQGEAEIGVVAGEVPQEALTAFPYRQDRIVLVSTPDHPVTAHARVRIGEVLDQPFVMLHAGSAFHTGVMNYVAASGGRLDVRIEVRSFEAVLRMASAGVGLGLVPRSTTERIRSVRPFAVVDVDEPWAGRDLSIIVRRDSRLSPHAQALVDALRHADGAALSRSAHDEQGSSL